MINNISIKTKMALIVTSLAMVAVISALVGLLAMRETNEFIRSSSRIRTDSIIQLYSVQNNLHNARSRALAIIGAESQQIIEDNANQILKFTENLHSSLDSYYGYQLSDDEKIMTEQFYGELKKYEDSRNNTIKFARSGDMDGAKNNLRTVATKYFISSMSILDDMIKNQLRMIEKTNIHLDEKYNKTFYIVVYSCGFIIFISLFFAFLVVRSVSAGINRVVYAMDRLSVGDLSTDIIDIHRKDEIGKLAVAAGNFKSAILMQGKLEEERKIIKERNEKERRESMLALADNLEINVRETVDVLEVSSGKMQKSASYLSEKTEEAGGQSFNVSSKSDAVSSAVQTVAVATENLSESISEISRQVTASARVAGDAVDQTRKTAEKITILVDAAQEIGEVVGLIHSIANQTNLLALNATIEAARAGDAGKGFAVVASEVKSLAGQTARATEAIQNKVSEIQQATGDARLAMEGIESTIHNMNEIATAIASAVEEQGAATRDITLNIQKASKDTQDVSFSIKMVSDAFSKSDASVTDVLSIASALSKESKILMGKVENFVKSIKEN